MRSGAVLGTAAARPSRTPRQRRGQRYHPPVLGEEALTELSRQHTDVSYLELSGVRFVDVAGVAALAVTAMNLPGGRVVVEQPPPQLPRVLELFWPSLRRIEVAPR